MEVDARGFPLLEEPLRMSLEDWLAWDFEGKSEWVDGEVIVSPPPNFDHGAAQARFCSIFWAVGLKTAVEVDMFTRDSAASTRIRRPDVCVYDHVPEGHPTHETPLVAIEVLSFSNRGEDLVRKSGEYAAWGVGQCWIVDPAATTLDVHENVGGAWERILQLTDGVRTGSVMVGEHGPVEIDLTFLLDLDD